MKQVRFKDLENNVIHGGIMTDEGDIICGCCGGLIEADELEGENKTHVILEIFHDWINLDEEICGQLYDDDDET